MHIGLHTHSHMYLIPMACPYQVPLFKLKPSIIVFHSVFTVDNNYIVPKFARNAINMKMSLFAYEEVRAVLKETKNSNACDPDGRLSKFLKHCAIYLICQ